MRFRTARRLVRISQTGKITPGQAQYLGRRAGTLAKQRQQRRSELLTSPQIARALDEATKNAEEALRRGVTKKTLMASLKEVQGPVGVELRRRVRAMPVKSIRNATARVTVPKRERPAASRAKPARSQPTPDVTWSPNRVPARSVPLLRDHPGFGICAQERISLERTLSIQRTDEKRLETIFLIIGLFQAQANCLVELDKQNGHRPAEDRLAFVTWSKAWISQGERRASEYVARRDLLKARVPETVPVVLQRAETRLTAILARAEKAEP